MTSLNKKSPGAKVAYPGLMGQGLGRGPLRAVLGERRRHVVVVVHESSVQSSGAHDDDLVRHVDRGGRIRVQLARVVALKGGNYSTRAGGERHEVRPS